MKKSIKELWIYPVKACQGVQVTEATVTRTGLEYDRTWCIVDVEGTHVPKLEAISGRRLPVLATIKVSFSADGFLCLDAPGMEQLLLPTSSSAYDECPTLCVESAGVTAAGPWSLALLECKQHMEGSHWITKYLNTPKGSDGRYVHGKSKKGTFALVRSTESVAVNLGQYPPIFPLISRAKNDPAYKARFEGNYRRLSDFAPFLLVSQSSADRLAEHCQVKSYPTQSFRGNIIVEGAEPWAEETWSELEIVSDKHDPMVLHSIKPCPRCTVPCRDQTTGAFLFAEKLKLWNVLKVVFPRKFFDPEWGGWAGAYMGVYMGHHGVQGKIAVGDTINPLKTVHWDAHLRKEKRNTIISVAGAVAALGVGLVMYTKSRK